MTKQQRGIARFLVEKELIGKGGCWHKWESKLVNKESHCLCEHCGCLLGLDSGDNPNPFTAIGCFGIDGLLARWKKDERYRDWTGYIEYLSTQQSETPLIALWLFQEFIDYHTLPILISQYLGYKENLDDKS